MTAAAVATIVFEEETYLEIIVKLLVVLLAGFGADFPTREVESVVCSDKGCVKCYSEQV